jgi:hypothetical protein
MGVADPRGFYDMTNATPNADARWMTAEDMRAWVSGAKPAIAYLDLGTRFP